MCVKYPGKKPYVNLNGPLRNFIDNNKITVRFGVSVNFFPGLFLTIIHAVRRCIYSRLLPWCTSMSAAVDIGRQATVNCND